jgi:hypothetical protein
LETEGKLAKLFILLFASHSTFYLFDASDDITRFKRCLLLAFILGSETCCLVSKFPFLETMAGGWGGEEVAGLPHCSPPAHSAQING